MKRQRSLLMVALLGCLLQSQIASAQQAAPFPTPFTNQVDLGTQYNLSQQSTSLEAPSTFLTGNHNFPSFINWISNPIGNIDPRAVTAIYPVFGASWVSSPPVLPDVSAQIYGPALTIALSDRLAIGLNQGGYANADLNTNDFKRILNDPRLAGVNPDLKARLLNIAKGGNRAGLLNLGAFGQYTLLENIESQFLLTAGVRIEAPCGAHEVFQGYGPAEMTPYVTFGKEFGEFHVLGTVGYKFPIGPGSSNQQVFNANLHVDRRVFGWLYPLVEVNSNYHVNNISVGLDTQQGFINLGSFQSIGNTVSICPGANVVIVPEKFEVGAVYTTVVSGQGNSTINGMIVKIVFRY